ncbi:hypothetical protein EDB81DRAFT_154426 [Dactylonectria macrodidyma]|uniref:Uncharacterized protein n=1 Tax=Dactylonectria macrodidyma TaxID=307937 RepID=A0A9P9FMP7_9HYPO|nr:hypothetical protein EDB81DRAFT_154426 [Dactylonectria macrodidyma]
MKGLCFLHPICLFYPITLHHCQSHIAHSFIQGKRFDSAHIATMFHVFRAPPDRCLGRCIVIPKTPIPGDVF